MLLSRVLLGLVGVAVAQITYQNSSGTILRTDNGTYGPEIEEFHYYYDQWPIGELLSGWPKIHFNPSRSRGFQHRPSVRMLYPRQLHLHSW